MNRKRHLALLLLVLTLLVGLFASACCFDPYYHHGRRGGHGHYRDGYGRYGRGASLTVPSEAPAPAFRALAA